MKKEEMTLRELESLASIEQTVDKPKRPEWVCFHCAGRMDEPVIMNIGFKQRRSCDVCQQDMICYDITGELD